MFAAGCHWADLLMRLALIYVLDDTIAAWPSIMAAVVADDVQIHAVGSTMVVARTMSGAYKSLARGLGAASLPLTMHKLCRFTTSKDLAMAIGKRAPDLDTSRVWQASNLGMDFAGGKVVGCHVRRKRLKKVIKWVDKIRALRRAGGKVRPLVTMGILPSMSFGSQ
eukprot:16429094-Heterocapsa_arctica.AAC.1